MNSLTSQILIDILNEEMSMPPNAVWIRDQNRLIPNDFGLYLIVGLVFARPMSNITYMQTEGSDQHQINRVMMKEDIQIDVLSRSNDALSRNWEVVAALQSFYSQQQQELNNFKIFRIPQSFINTSSAEGGSNINRYSITVPCFSWYIKDKILNSPLGDYYDDFTMRVDDAATIGTPSPVAEFEINSETPPPP